MMRRLFVTAIAALSVMCAMAQKLEVKTFKLEANDPAATQYAVKDLNGNNCALIIVGLAVDGVEFEGNIIKQERKANGEYWVYITDGSLEFQINTKDYLPEPVDFVRLGITKVEGGRTYRMNVEHPDLAKNFDELLADAEEYYKGYPSHTDFGFFEAAQLAYKAAFDHNDCPLDTREVIRTKRDSLLSIRNGIYLIEQTAKKAELLEKEKGFESVEVYKRLGAQLNYADKLLTVHPEMNGVKALREQLVRRIQTHPQGKMQTGTETVIHKRETLSGTVSFKSKYMALEFSQMRVYATTSRTIKGAKSRIIGKVNNDGTYSVVKPVDENNRPVSPLYIYVTGEKDEAHYVPEGTTTMDIIVK